MMLLERVKKLCSEKGITVTQLEDRLNLPHNTVYQWKKRTPSTERLQKVADYFDTSVDYLLGRTDEKVDWKKMDEKLANDNDGYPSKQQEIVKTFETIAAHARDRGVELTEEDMEKISEYASLIINSKKK
ncbi:helix-turn-helix transcriptional regulator [Listeria fleischmannii]|nr:helix-turn-helix transcriptional regulator [Listeria fleischmannii]